MKVEGYSKNRYLQSSSPLKHSPHFVNVSGYHSFAEYSGHQLLCRNSQPKNAHLQWNFLSSDEPKCPDGYFFISSGFLCRSFGQKEKCFPILIHHRDCCMLKNSTTLWSNMASSKIRFHLMSQQSPTVVVLQASNQN